MPGEPRRTKTLRPTGSSRRLFGPKWLGVTVIALFAGMLFWSKLRVSSVVPRSAYADPEAKQTAGSPGGDEHNAADPSDDATPDAGGQNTPRNERSRRPHRSDRP